MTAFFESEMLEAVSLSDHRAAISRVKDIVIRQLVATDERVSIHKTEYFNHTFVPDLVLKWERDPDQRFLFLRPNADPDVLLDDIGRIGDINPIYFTLDNIDRYAKSERRGDLQNLTRESETLVTDSQSIDTLIRARDEDPVARLASSVVLQGARGLLNQEETNRVSRAVTDGMRSASEVDTEGARFASQTISRSFDAKRSASLNRLLQAVWIGSGGSASNFPGRVDASAGLDEVSISYLLGLELIDDIEFWRRLGRRLSLDLLSGIRIDHFSPNFQMLISANLDVLDARVCRVERPVQTLLDSGYDEDARPTDSNLTWGLDRGNLTLRGPNFAAYLANRKDRFGDQSSGDGVAASFDDLVRSLSAQNLPIREITLQAQNKSVSYSSESEIYPANDDQLQKVSEALGASALVQSVVTVLPGHSPLTCDFRTSIVSGKTSALYPIGPLVRLALLLLADVSAEESRQLDELARTLHGGAVQQALFDFEPDD